MPTVSKPVINLSCKTFFSSPCSSFRLSSGGLEKTLDAGQVFLVCGRLSLGGILLVKRFIGFVSYPTDECNLETRNFLFLRALLREFVSALWRWTKNQGALSRSRYFQIGFCVFIVFWSAGLMLAWIECSHLISQSCFEFIEPLSLSFRSMLK